MVSNIKKIAFSVRTVLTAFVFGYKKAVRNEDENLAIWRHTLISGKHWV